MLAVPPTGVHWGQFKVTYTEFLPRIFNQNQTLKDTPRRILIEEAVWCGLFRASRLERVLQVELRKCPWLSYFAFLLLCDKALT